MHAGTIFIRCHSATTVSCSIETTSGVRCTWNAENRLMSVARTYPALAAPNEPPPVKVEFRYDYFGRRIEKRVLPWNPALNGGAGDWDDGNPTKVTRFVWSGWLMLLELDVDPNDANDPSTRRSYTWGLDLAGQQGSVNSLEAAGGIGGLLAISDPNDPNDPNDLFGDFAYTYDANGNVGQLIDWAHDPNDPNGAIVARYDYDPYGKVIGPDDDDDGDWRDDAGPYAVENPIRFSTKYWDDETGWGNWPIRYYDPVTGRWTSWDPIGERGGVNLYGYVANVPSNAIDARGWFTCGGRVSATIVDEVKLWEWWYRGVLSGPRMDEYWGFRYEMKWVLEDAHHVATLDSELWGDTKLEDGRCVFGLHDLSTVRSRAYQPFMQCNVSFVSEGWRVTLATEETAGEPYDVGECYQCYEGNVRYFIRIMSRSKWAYPDLGIGLASETEKSSAAAEYKLKICTNGYAKAERISFEGRNFYDFPSFSFYKQFYGWGAETTSFTSTPEFRVPE